jgi:hypothetical protein
VEAKPDVRELADLGIVLAPAQIDDVADAQGAELLDVAPSLDGTTEGKVLVNEEDLHEPPAF